jgi:4-amino-4-deoxy-L-arabinose transferase-like glycosyltransferase
MRLVPLGVAVVAAALYFAGLGEAPFVDPPEGVHAEIAREMAASGDWLTPRLNTVRYFDKPPLQYWLMVTSFKAGGVGTFTARLWSALAAVACAAVTARIGVLLGGPRVGLLAGLMTAANLGIFTVGRQVQPDLLFVLCITLAQAGFVLAYLGRGGRRGLLLFYLALGLAALAKDLVGAMGLPITAALFLWLTRERPRAPWWPWWGIGLLALTALPWYLAVEAANRGFLWYTVVDNHVLNFVRRRIFPDEGVPLGSLEFLAVTVAAFLPWSLIAPWAVARSLRRDWEAPADRLWLFFALWVLLVIGFFTLSRFKLGHYGLPAFPAMALLVARLWEETMTGAPRALRARVLLAPVAAVFALAATAAAAVWAGRLGVSRGTVALLDASTRSMLALGAPVPDMPVDALRPMLALCAVVFGVATVGLGLAIYRRSAELGVTVALAVMLAFLPAAGKGVVEFARSRSAEPIGQALVRRVQPGDTVVHEGALEHSASVLLGLGDPVHLVDGRVSNLGFGATFPDAREIFWNPSRLRAVWSRPGRGFLISTVAPERSVARSLPAGQVHLLTEAGGRRLYSNRPD